MFTSSPPKCGVYTLCIKPLSGNCMRGIGFLCLTFRTAHLIDVGEPDAALLFPSLTSAMSPPAGACRERERLVVSMGIGHRCSEAMLAMCPQ